jgi:protein subunit release factor A
MVLHGKQLWPTLGGLCVPCCCQVLELKSADTGGIKAATALVSGPGAFGQLRWESGVHRVTMVPGNEKQGKMQTGTAVVVAMPEASEVRDSAGCLPCTAGLGPQ